MAAGRPLAVYGVSLRQWSTPTWSRRRERLLRVHQSFAARFCGALRIAKSVGCAAIMPADTVAVALSLTMAKVEVEREFEGLGGFPCRRRSAGYPRVADTDCGGIPRSTCAKKSAIR
jgi:hypothetical protein